MSEESKLVELTGIPHLPIAFFHNQRKLAVSLERAKELVRGLSDAISEVEAEIAANNASLKEAMDAIAEMENEIINNNLKILEEIGCSKEQFDKYVEDVTVTGKLEIVREPKGDIEPFEEFTESIPFREQWVEQWSSGPYGDSFTGFIYAKFGENKWLKIPYTC